MNDLPQDLSTLSVAIAGMVGQLVMPHQFNALMSKAVLSVNDQCPVTVKRIDK